MAGTIIVDRIESDASYASTINVANRITFSNTVNFGVFAGTAPVAGFYLPTTNNLAFTTASTERMRIDSSGNVGIGTASPSVKLDVIGSGKFTGITEFTNAVNLTTSTLNYVYFNDAIAFARNGTGERMRIDSSGNVGIGTTAPTARLTIASGTNEGAVRVGDNATYYGALSRVQATDEVRLGAYGPSQNLVFYTNASERARILSTGQVLIDRTTNTNSGKLEIYGDSDGAFNPLTLIQGAAGATSRNSIVFYRVSAGASVGTIQTTNTATTYNTSSDYRLKENITPMTGALAKVALLKPCTYKWKIDGSDGQGFIAHELDEVVSGCVTGEKDAVDADGKPQYQGIDTSFLVATLTAAIQEQQALITALTTRITALEST